MAEKDFQSGLAAGMHRVPGAHYYKIPDLPVHAIRQAGLKIGAGAKPYDCFILHRCIYFACELKQSRAMCLGKDEVRDHQEAALLEVTAAGGVGLVLVNFQVKLSAKAASARGVETLDVAYGAPMVELVAARAALCRDSIPLDWWEANGWPLERFMTGKQIKWDPTPLLAGARAWRMRTPL